MATMTMTMTMLTEYARRLIAVSQNTVANGESVLPALAILTHADEFVVFGMPDMPPHADERGAMLAAFVRMMNARAAVFFADAVTRDNRTGAKTGEALVASVQAANGFQTAFVCRYTRDPLVFEPIQEYPRSNGAYPLFPQTVH